jgi:hypothetical protein
MNATTAIIPAENLKTRKQIAEISITKIQDARVYGRPSHSLHHERVNNACKVNRK